MLFPSSQIQCIPTPLLWVAKGKTTPFVSTLASQRTVLKSADYVKTVVIATNEPTRQSVGIAAICLVTHDGKRLVTHDGKALAVCYGNYRLAPIVRKAVPASHRVALVAWQYSDSPPAAASETAAQGVTLSATIYAPQKTTAHKDAAAHRVGFASYVRKPAGKYSGAQPLSQKLSLSAFSYTEK